MKQLQQVVVIEENPLTLHWFCQILPELGFAVVVCPLPTGIQHFVVRQQPHLVLCNLSLRQLNGRLLAYLLKQNPATKAIPLLCYGLSDPIALAQEQHLCGADGCLTSPQLKSALFAQLSQFERHRSLPMGEDKRAIQVG